jgi:hypothetical protein
MPPGEIPASIRQYVFENIDSVEQLEILLFLRDQTKTWHTSETIASNLRINPKSARNRLAHLHELGLLSQSPEDTEKFIFAPRTPELTDLVQLLGEEYKIRKHRVLEIIFSPAKRARQFAAAFAITKAGRNNGEDNG